jgi:hypothetical protein
MIKTLMVGLTLGMCVFYAEDKRAMKQSDLTVDTVVANGWLILYGVLIERPYHFYFEDDTCYINDLQYLPPPSDPLRIIADDTFEYSELGAWFTQTNKRFLDSCLSKYKRWRVEYGAEIAVDSLVHYVGLQELLRIKSFEVVASNDAATIIYDYKHLDLISNPSPQLVAVLTKPYAEYFSVSLVLWTEADEDTARSHLTQREIFLNECSRMISLLQNGVFLYISYSGWCEIGRVRHCELEFIRSIQRILSKKTSRKEAVDEIQEKTLIDSLKAEYIFYNRDSWLNAFEEDRDE